MLWRASGHMERPCVGAAADNLCPGARHVSWDTFHNSIFQPVECFWQRSQTLHQRTDLNVPFPIPWPTGYLSITRCWNHSKGMLLHSTSNLYTFLGYPGAGPPTIPWIPMVSRASPIWMPIQTVTRAHTSLSHPSCQPRAGTDPTYLIYLHILSNFQNVRYKESNTSSVRECYADFYKHQLWMNTLVWHALHTGKGCCWVNEG